MADKKTILNLCLFLFWIFTSGARAQDGDLPVESSSAAKKIEVAGEELNYEIDFTPQEPSDLEREIEILRDAKRIYANAKIYVKQRRELLGEDIFAEQVAKGNVIYSEVGLGEGKVTYINGVEIICVKLYRYRLAIPFVRVDEHSDHLTKYIARQQRNSGRDVLLIRTSQEDEVKSLEFHPYASFFSSAGLKSFWDSIRERPTGGNWLLGGVCGVYQAGLTVCLNVAKTALAQGDASMLEAVSSALPAAAMTAAFATTIGVLCGPYRNLIYNGTKWERWAKSGIISAAFALTFIGLLEGAHALNLFSHEGLKNLSSIALNVVLTNITKDDWQQIVRAKAQLRHTSGNVELGGVNTGISRKDAANQLVYNIGSLPFKLLDQMKLKWGAIPVGKIAFYLTLPVVRYFNKFWFMRRYMAMREEYKAEPSEERGIALRKLNERLSEVEESWQELLKMGTYAALPLVKIINEWWLKDSLRHYQELYAIEPSAELRLKIMQLSAQVRYVDGAWAKVQALPARLAGAVRNAPEAARQVRDKITAHVRRAPAVPRCGLTFADVDAQTLDEVFGN